MSFAPSGFVSIAANAQVLTPSAQPSPRGLTLQEVAKVTVNPFADSIKLPFESTTGFDVGAHHNATEAMNIQPLVPFSLSCDWVLLARPSITAAFVPSPHEQYGLSDLQASFFLTPANEKTWVFGVGPIFQFPTATAKELGTGRWSAGPTAGLIYSEGPWFGGILGYQLLSFAGDRERGSVNQTYVEPDISYSFDSGWYIQCDPQITYDWTAEHQDAWTIPAGLDVGKAFKLGSEDASLEIGSYDLTKHPEGAPQWIVRVSLTLVVPPFM